MSSPFSSVPFSGLWYTRHSTSHFKQQTNWAFFATQTNSVPFPLHSPHPNSSSSSFSFLVWLLYNVVSVSATQQCESAISMHRSPHSWTCLLTPSHPHRVELSVLYSSFPLVVRQNVYHFTHGRVHVNSSLPICPTLCVPLCPQPIVYIRISIPALQAASWVPFF